MKKVKLLLISSIILATVVSPAWAATKKVGNTPPPAVTTTTPSSTAPAQTQIVQAQVVKILAEKDVIENGAKLKQQNLSLKILTGPLTGRLEKYIGISDLQVTANAVYQVGDKVIVTYAPDGQGGYTFFITDYVRSNSLLWLLLFFVLVVLAVGHKKGLRALLAFLFSFLFIVYVMVPLFMLGWNATVIGLLGSVIVLTMIIYLTDGINRKSNIAALGILCSLIFTAILALIFVSTNHLTGMSSDEVTYLIGAVSRPLDYKNLLLAAMFIGILGILDDVVVGQVEAVQQIKEANAELTDGKVFRMAFKVGQSHLGAIINTLFLAYISTALPLILLISLHQQPFATMSDVINNEQVATEIVRILVGVAGLCSAIPISTWLAAKYLKVEAGS